MNTRSLLSPRSFLALLLAAGCFSLSGCGDSSEPEAAAEAAKAEAPAAPAEAEAVVAAPQPYDIICPRGKPRMGSFGLEGIAFSPDGKRMVIYDSWKRLTFWDVQTRQVLDDVQFSMGLVQSFRFSPDGSLMCCYDGGFLKCFKVAEPELPGDPVRLRYANMNFNRRMNDYALSPDGSKVVIAQSEYDKSLLLLDVATQQPVGEPIATDGGADSVSFSPDGRLIKAQRWQRGVFVWDAETGQQVAGPFESEGFIFHSFFTPDGSKIAVVGTEGVSLWDVATQQLVTKLPTETNSCCMSPDGKYLAIRCGKDVRVREIATGKQPGPTVQHQSEPSGMTITPDGAWLVTLEGAVVHFWPLEEGKPVLPAPKPEDAAQKGSAQ